MYLFILIDVMGKCLHRLSNPPFSSLVVLWSMVVQNTTFFCSFILGLYLEVSLRLSTVLVFSYVGVPLLCSLVFKMIIDELLCES